MPFETYRQTRPWAAAIRQATQKRAMPPWFADPCCGHFSNDPSLSTAQIETIAAWVRAGSPEGNPKEAPPPVAWVKGWNIDKPDAVFTMPQAKAIPATGEISYQYIIIPANFKEDLWVRMSEIRPGNRRVVHHAVVYVRDPASKWLRGAPVGVPFDAEALPTPELRRDAMWTNSEVLLVYAPGSSPDQWPDGFARLIPAGSDIVLQMHYTTNGRATSDRTSVGLVFLKDPPRKRVITLQLTNDHFIIPPGVPNQRVEVHGSLPNDALLLSFFPHMHLRGKNFEYNILGQDRSVKTLLRIPHYDFFWQLSYRLTEPMPLKGGTILQAIATFDNSRNNPHNPDPEAAVTWGGQTSSEMMIGFFDIAIDPAVDKQQYFVRPK